MLTFKRLSHVVALIAAVQTVSGQSFARLGCVFDSEVAEAELAFDYAVEIVNNEILAPSGAKLLDGVHLKVPYSNEYLVSRKLCRLLKSGVAGIIGPQAPTSAVHVQSICDAKEMPHIDTRFDPMGGSMSASINIHPDPQTLAQVYVHLMQAFDWASFTILFENGPYILGMADLLKLYDPKGHTITVRQLDLGTDNYRAILRRVKLSDEKFIMLHCSAAILPEVLKQAQQVGLMSDEHNFMITSLDLHTVDLEPYQYGGTNITGIRLIDPEDPRVVQITTFWREKEEGKGQTLPDGMAADKIATEVALIFDSVVLFAEAFNQLQGTRQIEATPLSCEDTDTWVSGYSFQNFMKTTHTRGLTRDIRFDHKGRRSDFTLDIVELGSAGLEKIGEWNSTHGLNLTRFNLQSSVSADDGSLKNRTFIVLTALSPPYGMLKESANQLSGNDRFEGFGIDLIHELSLMLGFNYTFHLQEDGVYGSLGANQQWNGMIRELLDKRADLAITDLTITSDRESAVDFTMPFMNLGISILYRKPTKQPPSLFSFMSPFSTEVWLYLGMGYIGVSIILFILGRISPGEWDNPYACIEEPVQLENQFSLRNAFWFTIGALLQQGTELAPKAPATRAVVSIWWFFTLIMVSSYTANLAAFLTIESLFSPIDNAEDLANQDGAIKYGAKRDGSTISFFKDAEYPTYQKMYEFMQANPDLLTSSNPEGLNRVKNENYAFLMESTSIEYIIERECDVTQVGGLLDDKGYGIAMRKNSPYRSALSEGVLRLQEQGKLTKNKIKWWKEKRGGGACTAASDDSGALALGIANVGGVFLLLIIGALLSIIINFLEFLFNTKAQAKEFKRGASDDKAEDLDMANMGGVFLVLLVGSSLATLFAVCELVAVSCRRAHLHNVPFREELMSELHFVAQFNDRSKTVRYRDPSTPPQTPSKHSGSEKQPSSIAATDDDYDSHHYNNSKVGNGHPQPDRKERRVDEENGKSTKPDQASEK